MAKKHKKHNMKKKHDKKKGMKKKHHKNKAPKQIHAPYKGDASWYDEWEKYEDEQLDEIIKFLEELNAKKKEGEEVNTE